MRARNDQLGEYIRLHTEWYQSMPWDAFVAKVRGRGDLDVQPSVQRHPAYNLLKQVQHNGVPVVLTSKPWSKNTRNKRMKRGSHQSCQEHLDFLREEMLDFVKKGFWTLLPYRLLQHLPQLRLSPLGIIPQRDRRPRLIVNYSFYGVNDETLKMMPAESMQFGRALERILYSIRHANP